MAEQKKESSEMWDHLLDHSWLMEKKSGSSAIYIVLILKSYVIKLEKIRKIMEEGS